MGTLITIGKVAGLLLLVVIGLLLWDKTYKTVHGWDSTLEADRRTAARQERKRRKSFKKALRDMDRKNK